MHQRATNRLVSNLRGGGLKHKAGLVELEAVVAHKAGAVRSQLRITVPDCSNIAGFYELLRKMEGSYRHTKFLGRREGYDVRDCYCPGGDTNKHRGAEDLIRDYWSARHVSVGNGVHPSKNALGSTLSAGGVDDEDDFDEIEAVLAHKPGYSSNVRGPAGSLSQVSRLQGATGFLVKWKSDSHTSFVDERDMRYVRALCCSGQGDTDCCSSVGLNNSFGIIGTKRAKMTRRPNRHRT